MARPNIATQVPDYLNTLNISPNFSLIEKGVLAKCFRRLSGRSVAANVAATTTTLADVDGMQFTLKKGSKYRIDGKLLTLGDATGGIKAALTSTGQTSPTIVLTGTADLAASSATQRALSGGTIFSAAGVIFTVTVSGYIIADGNGTLTLQFAQSAANGTSTLYAGSWIKLVKVG